MSQQKVTNSIMTQELVIIGGGPAGLAAALAAREAGLQEILILERDKELGGILNQCIHNGFGLHTFQEELTGPEYAARFSKRVEEEKIPCLLNTMVINLELLESGAKKITVMNRELGLLDIHAKAVILAMGCRERPRGALNIPGYRPAGIYSAGTAQRYVNIEGRMPGKEVVILGSGDIGLIMARRMTLEGARVKVVAELMPYSGGLKRNIAQCLNDFGIPLKLSHTVIDIHGKERVTGVTLAQVDENRRPIPGTEEEISCDTLLLSCGLIPENELSNGLGVELNPVTSGPFVNESLETSVPGVFACGNVLHVHDLVDYVSEEAAAAGRHAASYVQKMVNENDGCVTKNRQKGHIQEGHIQEGHRQESTESNPLKAPVIRLCAEQGVRYTVPAAIRPEYMAEEQLIRFRVGDVYREVYLNVYFDDIPVISQKKRVMAPGEMEQLRLKKQQLLQYPEISTITLRIETENPLKKEVH